jgi:hypothetical protein
VETFPKPPNSALSTPAPVGIRSHGW